LVQATPPAWLRPLSARFQPAQLCHPAAELTLRLPVPLTRHLLVHLASVLLKPETWHLKPDLHHHPSARPCRLLDHLQLVVDRSLFLDNNHS
jgi:hypothetical protein